MNESTLRRSQTCLAIVTGIMTAVIFPVTSRADIGDTSELFRYTYEDWAKKCSPLSSSCKAELAGAIAAVINLDLNTKKIQHNDPANVCVPDDLSTGGLAEQLYKFENTNRLYRDSLFGVSIRLSLLKIFGCDRKVAN